MWYVIGDRPVAVRRFFLFIGIAFSVLLAAFFLPRVGVAVPLAKYFIALLLIGLFFIAPFPLFSQERLLLVVLFIFFPVTLNVLGKDAISVASILILAMALACFIGILAKQPELRLEKVRWVLLLLAIAGLGIVKSPRGFWGPEIRHYLNFASGILLFLMILNWPKICGGNGRDFARRLFNLLVVMACVQVLIGITVSIWPSLGEMFSVFLERTKEELSLESWKGWTRLNGLVLEVEEMGEIIAMLLPLVVYLAFQRSRWYWLFFLILVTGLFMANTRSTILLGVMGCIPIFFAYLKKAKVRQVAPLALLIFITLIIMLCAGTSVFDAVVNHMIASIKSWQSGGGLMTAVNRQQVWPDAWKVTMSTLSLFGNGPAPSRVVGLNELNMHCLYLTLLYQFGIAGAVIYLLIPLSILVKLVLPLGKPNPLRSFRLVCAISLAIFLINEIKFEFNRSDSYQQLIWAMLAFYALHAQKENEEVA